jgi:hypothetical protein
MKLITGLLAIFISFPAFAIEFGGPGEELIHYKITSRYYEPGYYFHVSVNLKDANDKVIFNIFSGRKNHQYTYRDSQTPLLGYSTKVEMSDEDAEMMLRYVEIISPECHLDVTVEKRTGKITEVSSPCV